MRLANNSHLKTIRLRVGKPLGCMLNKQVLRVKKPTNQALQNTSLRIENRQTRHYRTQVYELNTPFLLTTSVPSTTQTALKPLPLNRKHVSRQAHPLLWRGLGRLPLRTCSPLLYPTVSSHIPSFGGAWGGSFSLVFGLASLVCAFCFLSISFLLTFPSTPFHLLKDALLHRKRASFAV